MNNISTQNKDNITDYSCSTEKYKVLKCDMLETEPQATVLMYNPVCTFALLYGQ